MKRRKDRYARTRIDARLAEAIDAYLDDHPDQTQSDLVTASLISYLYHRNPRPFVIDKEIKSSLEEIINAAIVDKNTGSLRIAEDPPDPYDHH